MFVEFYAKFILLVEMVFTKERNTRWVYRSKFLLVLAEMVTVELSCFF